MTEITAEGPISTMTVIDNKNGAVPMPHMKLSKKSVSEDFATTFSSPAAWLLVAALIVTWSAVAIVMFDLVDYKTLAGVHQLDIDKDVGTGEIPRGQSVNKLTTDPLRLVYGAVEDTTSSIYGFLSLMSDLIFEDDEESEKGEEETPLKVKEEVQPPIKKKEIQIDKAEKEEKTEKKPPPKEIQREKAVKEEKIEKKPSPKTILKEKPEKIEKPEKPEKVKKPEKPEKAKKPEKPEKVKKPEKPEKLEKTEKREVPKVVHKEKPERHEKPEKREKPEKKSKPEQKEKIEKKEKVPLKEKPTKEEKSQKKVPPSPKVAEKVKEKVKTEQQEKTEKKVAPKDKKSIKVEEKAKKDVKERKPETKAPESVKHKETKIKEAAPEKAKAKAKEEVSLQLAEKSDTKDQYAFCRYMIDMFAHGDLYTGPTPQLFLPQTPAISPGIPASAGKFNFLSSKILNLLL
ncbi:triadin isoform X1 [Anolis sagrei]|uniref:triadin isoform X1 n=1 Tax=Anolis sagrei TaxID=38937 RepID=UPI0035214E8E